MDLLTEGEAITLFMVTVLIVILSTMFICYEVCSRLEAIKKLIEETFGESSAGDKVT